MQFTINLAAGQKVRQQTAGSLFVIVSTGAAPAVELTLWNGNMPLEEIRTAGRGFKARVPGQFTHIDMMASVACVVEVVISNGAVDFDFISGTTVNVTATAPLPVSNDRGAPANPVYVSGITYSDAPATSMLNGAAVAVGAAAVAIVAANAARKALRLTNIGADPCAVGAPGITWAARCIVLNAGDTWVEERGANLAWSAICDAAKAASVTAQEVIA